MSGLNRRRIALWVFALLALCLALRAGLWWTGVWGGAFGGTARELVWQLDWPERAYNFGVVVPGRIYRSAQPDDRFIEYLHRQYGIRHVISLNGKHRNAFHARAKALGMRVDRFYWTHTRLPPEPELRQVLALMDAGPPVLVHCAAGKDRTGFAVAAYRIYRESWDYEDAFDEMDSFWHKPDKLPWFQGYLMTHPQPP